MMLLRPQTPTFSSPPTSSPSSSSRKRKADNPPESNERLSKRLSLLNLEQNGQQKLYVPVENSQRANYTTTYSPSSGYVTRPVATAATSNAVPQVPNASAALREEEPMQLDNTKHKVYIYNIDDELSSESEYEAEDERVVFLPDIEKHLRRNRIPQAVLTGGTPGPDERDLAAMQMVLYSVPSSISVPEEQDSVRKAIIEARHRLRERQQAQQEERDLGRGGGGTGTGVVGGDAAMDEDDADAMELD